MGWRERRRLARAEKEGASRAANLAAMRRTLEMTDEFIAREQRFIREKSKVERGQVYMPPPAYLIAVNIRPRIVEVISDLEGGVPMEQVNAKIAALDRERESWEKRAKNIWTPGPK
jgi:hypothetical protein